MDTYSTIQSEIENVKLYVSKDNRSDDGVGRTNFGRCCTKGSLKRYTEYDFYIEISGHTLQNTERSLRNTLIHELIHTVPDGLCHTGEWKRWARYVSAKTGYDIQRCGGRDDTLEDVQRLETGVQSGMNLQNKD